MHETSDVTHLPWIENAVLRQRLRWMFSRIGYETEIIVAQSAIRTDNTPAAYACVLAGAGVWCFRIMC